MFWINFESEYSKCNKHRDISESGMLGVVNLCLYRNPSLQELRARVKPPRFMNDQLQTHIDFFLGWKVTMMHCILIVQEIFENCDR